LIQYGKLNLGWTWLIVIGTAITFGLAYLWGPTTAGPKADTGN